MDQEVSYPLRQDKSKWTPDYRREWNREYRRKIKEGLIIPQKRKEEPSKWEDKSFRKAYDTARKAIIQKEKQEKKLNCEMEARPNYTKEEKDIILGRLLDQIREGKTPEHPFFQLGLLPLQKRQYPKRSQEKSSSD